MVFNYTLVPKLDAEFGFLERGLVIDRIVFSNLIMGQDILENVVNTFNVTPFYSHFLTDNLFL